MLNLVCSKMSVRMMLQLDNSILLYKNLS